jgi:hypothetical protein
MLAYWVVSWGLGFCCVTYLTTDDSLELAGFGGRRQEMFLRVFRNFTRGNVSTLARDKRCVLGKAEACSRALESNYRGELPLLDWLG